MSVPGDIDLDALYQRSLRIYQDARTAMPRLPERVNELLKDVTRTLTKTPPDLRRLSHLADGILAWFFDEGFADVPIHVSVSTLALDLVKMVRVAEMEALVGAMPPTPDTPETLPEVREMFDNLGHTFAPDGRMDEERYQALALRLHDVLNRHRAFWEGALEMEIIRI